jgi:methionine-gamma-lyase
MSHQESPLERLANARHFFGEFGGINKSIEASSTFTVMRPEEMQQLFTGEIPIGINESGGSFLYSRHTNPTVAALAHELAAIEGTEAALCTASGMAAISCTITQICDSGDHIVASNCLYGGTYALLHDYLPKKMKIDVTFVPPNDLEAMEKAITNKTKMIYTETLSNPLLQVSDIPKMAEIAKKHNIKLVVDNTFTPMIFSPAKLGADVVVYSMTKFINGASDYVAGCICGKKEIINSLMDLHTGSAMLLGPTMDPSVAFVISTRLPHLGIRMKAHAERSLYLAKKLEKVKGLRVIYPGLDSHPQKELFEKLANKEFGYGGIVSIDFGSHEMAYKVMDNLQNKQNFGYMAVSLGYNETLMSCSGSSTSSEMDEEALKKTGITPGLVRFALGYSGTHEQRWKQLKAGLKECGFEVDDAL